MIVDHGEPTGNYDCLTWAGERCTIRDCNTADKQQNCKTLMVDSKFA